MNTVYRICRKTLQRDWKSTMTRRERWHRLQFSENDSKSITLIKSMKIQGFPLTTDDVKEIEFEFSD